MIKILASGTILALSCGAATLVQAAGDPEAGKALFAVCAACHGANGEGSQVLNAPANAGQDEWYVIRQLNNFRDGTRGAHGKDIFGAQMRPMAMQLANEQAVEDVAAYVASLPPPSPATTIEGDAAAGQKAYVTCIACHGENGEGNTSLNAPRLSGQHDWYIVRQLENFKAGVRGANPKDIYGAQMKPMAEMLATEEQVRDVTAYIATLD